MKTKSDLFLLASYRIVMVKVCSFFELALLSSLCARTRYREFIKNTVTAVTQSNMGLILRKMNARLMRFCCHLCCHPIQW